jgi:hypothetical protein
MYSGYIIYYILSRCMMYVVYLHVFEHASLYIYVRRKGLEDPHGGWQRGSGT